MNVAQVVMRRRIAGVELKRSLVGIASAFQITLCKQSIAEIEVGLGPSGRQRNGVDIALLCRIELAGILQRVAFVNQRRGLSLSVRRRLLAGPQPV